MNILVLTPLIPYPLSEGGKVAQFAVINSLRHRHNIYMILCARNTKEVELIKELQVALEGVEIEVIELFTRQRQDRTSLKKRILNGLKYHIKKTITLLSLKRSITNKQFDKSTHLSNIDSLANFISTKPYLLIERIGAVIKNRDIDLVQIDFLEYADLVLAIPSHIKTVFVHHELRFSRLATTLNIKSDQVSYYDRYIVTHSEMLELTILKKFNAIIVFSEVDKSKLKQKISNVLIEAIPFCVMDTEIKLILKKDFRIDKMVFVGGDDHYPNKDGVEWFIRDIMPEIRKHLNIDFHIIGKWSSDVKMSYRDKPFVFFAGYVEDLYSYCKNSVMIVPLRIGSGIRTKILYAMAQGIPVISTSLGCEGILVNENQEILIADYAEKFVEALKSIVSNPSFSYEISINAQNIIRSYYSSNHVSDMRDNLYSQVLKS